MSMSYEEHLAYARKRLEENPPPPPTTETVEHLRMLARLSRREQAIDGLAEPHESNHRQTGAI